MNIDISLAIGLASLALSIVFFTLSAISERRNRKILEAINSAIKEWQTKIMASAIEYIESRPEIVSKRAHLAETTAKTDFLHELAERIKFIIENPKTDQGAIPQSSNLKILLDTFLESTKSAIPSDVLSDILKKRHIQEPDKAQKPESNTKDD